MRIAIVTGSTRPGGNNIAVARWVLELAATRRDATFELVDIADYQLPLLDEPLPPVLRRDTHSLIAWSGALAGLRPDSRAEAA